MHPLLNIGIQAARKAGDIINRNSDRLDTLTFTEKTQNEFASEIDQQAEQAIIQVIHKAYPSHSILGEEFGAQGDRDEYQWIIDPLDGTTNFMHGFPHYCVSIAVKVKNQIEHGVIYDPVRQELFTASRGQGTQLNDKRLRVSSTVNLKQALIGTGFPFRNPQHAQAYFESFTTLLPLTSDVRRTGSAALDLAYVAAGRQDGFWELGLNIWDTAAAILMIKEAGGLVSDFNGGESYLETGRVVAGNPKIFKAILQHLPQSLRQIG